MRELMTHLKRLICKLWGHTDEGYYRRDQFGDWWICKRCRAEHRLPDEYPSFINQCTKS